jgi:hypothetical protein
VRFGLKGWRNFKDAAGSEITPAFVKAFIAGKSYQVLADDVVRQLDLPASWSDKLPFIVARQQLPSGAERPQNGTHRFVDRRDP